MSHCDFRGLIAASATRTHRPGPRVPRALLEPPLLDPENTGALAIFVFRPGPGTESPKCRAWICRNLVETDVADDLIGPVEPGFPVPWGY